MLVEEDIIIKNFNQIAYDRYIESEIGFESIIFLHIGIMNEEDMRILDSLYKAIDDPNSFRIRFNMIRTNLSNIFFFVSILFFYLYNIYLKFIILFLIFLRFIL